MFVGARSGTLIIDFSTIRPDVTVELARQARAKGLRLLDAPVSGGEAGAVNGGLSIMVGGDAGDFAAARPRRGTRGGRAGIPPAAWFRRVSPDRGP